MKRIILGIVVLLAAGLGGALDYSLAAKTAGPSYGFLDHVQARAAFATNLLPQSQLAKVLPAPPPGWTVRKATDEDSFTVAGLPVDPVQLERTRQIDDALQNGITGLQVERRTYENGGQAVYLDVTFVPANTTGSRGARLAEQVFSALAAQAQTPESETGSFAFHRLSLPEFGKAALFFTSVEEQVYISALSSADEGVTLDFLHSLDRAALLQMIATDPTIGKDPVAEDPIVAVEEPEKADPCTSRGAAKFCGIGG